MKIKPSQTLEIGGFLFVAAFLAGVCVGRSSVPDDGIHTEAPPPVESLSAPATDATVLAKQVRTTQSASDTPAAPPVEPAPAVGEPAHAHGHQELALSRAEVLASGILDKTDAELIGLFAMADDPAIRRELLWRLKADPSKLTWALEAFAQETDPALLGAWSRLLGSLDDQGVRAAVQGMALDVARAKESRVAALRVLEKHRSLDAIPAVKQLLEAEADTDVLKAAMYTLPNPRGASRTETEGVAGAIVQRTSDPSVEVRRVATAKLSDWPHDPAVRPTLVETLRSDGAASVRAAAAFSLIWVPKDDALLETLASKVQDSDEEWLVRENAWRALGAGGVLPANAAAVYQGFKQERRSRRRSK